jgi:hypothetical protein
MHVHDHTHDSDHSENPYAGQGSVLLDIGGDVGALVVEMPEALVGQEVDIWPADLLGGHHHPRHVAVVARPTPVGPLPTLVFGGLLEGAYVLCDKGATEVRMTCVVRGGEVTQEVWPTS